MDKYNFQIRVTGILLEDEKILLVKQKISADREWSLPGGRVEAGETIEEALVRELLEETGLSVKINKLLYVCDKLDCKPPMVHIIFLLDKINGDIVLPTNEFDANPISDVKFIEFAKLKSLGFSEEFVTRLYNRFSDYGNYMGLKKNIGL